MDRQKEGVVFRLAEELDGIQYLEERPEIWKKAKEDGAVVVFGFSDDGIEFRGAVDDELGAFDGGTFYIDSTGNISGDSGAGKRITAVWCGTVEGRKVSDHTEISDSSGRIIPWTYKTDIPCGEFMMYEEDAPFCRGIVFLLRNLEEETGG